MQRVGVTGAAGFIGSHLCERLLDEGVEVVGVDDMSFGSRSNLEHCLDDRRFRLEILDAGNRRPLRAAFDGCDAILHLAAMKIPRYGGALRTLESNVAGVNAAAAVALAIDADLIVASTSDVYGNAPAPLRRGRPDRARPADDAPLGVRRFEALRRARRARARRRARPARVDPALCSTSTGRTTTSPGGAARSSRSTKRCCADRRSTSTATASRCGRSRMSRTPSRRSCAR